MVLLGTGLLPKELFSGNVMEIESPGGARKVDLSFERDRERDRACHTIHECRSDRRVPEA
jgi:hypothetical protein